MADDLLPQPSLTEIARDLYERIRERYGDDTGFLIGELQALHYRHPSTKAANAERHVAAALTAEGDSRKPEKAAARKAAAEKGGVYG